MEATWDITLIMIKMGIEWSYCYVGLARSRRNQNFSQGHPGEFLDRRLNWIFNVNEDCTTEPVHECVSTTCLTIIKESETNNGYDYYSH